MVSATLLRLSCVFIASLLRLCCVFVNATATLLHSHLYSHFPHSHLYLPLPLPLPLPLQVYATQLTDGSPQLAYVDRELINIEKARNMLHASHLQSEVSIAVKRLEKELHVLCEDVHDVFLGQDLILSHLNLAREKKIKSQNSQEDLHEMQEGQFVSQSTTAAAIPQSNISPSELSYLDQTLSFEANQASAGAMPVLQMANETQQNHNNVTLVPETAKFFI